MKNNETGNNRRQFIKKGLFGMAGIVSAGEILKSIENTSAENSSKKGNIIFRKLGKTGIKLPIISIGAACYDANLYKRALDLGIKHIDTSEYYYNGRHEQLVGEVIKGRPRESVIIATSMLLDKTTTAITLCIDDASKIAPKLEKSFKRLGVDFIDIFYVGGVKKREHVLNEAVISALSKLKKSGKIRFAGVSTHHNEPEIINAAIETQFYDVVLSAYNFKQLHHAEIKEAMTKASNAGIGIIAMKNLGGGFWDKERKHPINGKAALKWALKDEIVHTAIPGIVNLEQLENSLSIMEDLKLTPQEKADLKLGEKLSLSGLYCQQCQQCIPQCPHGLDIPTIMRSYMYAYGYANLSKAWECLKNVDLNCNDCSKCNHCSVQCKVDFNIQEKVQDIMRLKNIPKDFLI